MGMVQRIYQININLKKVIQDENFQASYTIWKMAKGQGTWIFQVCSY